MFAECVLVVVAFGVGLVLICYLLLVLVGVGWCYIVYSGLGCCWLFALVVLVYIVVVLW